MDPIQRPCLGRHVSLGEVYDARTDTFCGVNLFETNILEKFVKTIDAPFTCYQTVRMEDFAEKCQLLGVEGDQQLSLLAGMVHTEGSGRYLTDPLRFEYSELKAYFLNTRTYDESINFLDDDLLNRISKSQLESAAKSGTHVVCGISNGATALLSCLAKRTGNADDQRPSGDQFRVDDYSDNDLLGDRRPTNVKEVEEIFRNAPSCLENLNEGKGRPKLLRLMPLKTVVMFLEDSKTTTLNYIPVGECHVRKVVRTVEEASKDIQELKDFYGNVQGFQYCIPLDNLESISNFVAEMTNGYSSYKSQLKNLLILVRSGESHVMKLDELVFEIQTNCKEISATLSGWKQVRDRINIARLFQKMDIRYVGNNTSLDAELINVSPDQKSYLLYFSQVWKKEDPETWMDNMRLFLDKSEQEERQHSKFFAMDCDIHPNPSIDNTRVQVIQAGKILFDHLFAEMECAKRSPTVRAISGKTERIHSKPTDRAPFSIPCPGKYCDPANVHEWICENCSDALEYGIHDSAVFCKCGRTPVNCLEFRCNHSKHFQMFEKHEDGALARHVKEIMASEELNILVVGETGVGKSTLIHAILHKFLLDSLDKDMTGNMSKLVAGTDHLAKSKTTKTLVYRLRHGNKIIRLIDTPGVASLGGVEDDEKNLQNVIATASKLDEIHGILLMVRAEDAKGSMETRYCVSKILSYFHQDAAKNIMFCVTHTSPSNFSPGNRLSILQNLLTSFKKSNVSVSPRNMFCVDMEALGHPDIWKTTKLPRNHGEEEISSLSESREKFAEEMKRMLNYVQEDLKPHKTKLSLLVNFAREYVLESPKQNERVELQDRLSKNFLKYSRECAKYLTENAIIDVCPVTEIYWDHLIDKEDGKAAERLRKIKAEYISRSLHLKTEIKKCARSSRLLSRSAEPETMEKIVASLGTESFRKFLEATNLRLDNTVVHKAQRIDYQEINIQLGRSIKNQLGQY